MEYFWQINLICLFLGGHETHPVLLWFFLGIFAGFLSDVWPLLFTSIANCLVRLDVY
jgi:hypothetical protein